MTKTDYRSVTAVAEIQEYIGSAKVVAFDYETAPDISFRDEDKAALDPAKAHIVGCSYSVKEGTAIYVPIAHLAGTNVDSAEFWQFQKQFLMNPEVTKVAHNLSFEAMMSYHLGIVIQSPVYDTIAACQMTQKSKWEFRKLSESGLKRMATEQFGVEMPSFTDVTNGRHFDEMNPQEWETVRYGCADSDMTLRLYNKCNYWFDRFLPQHRKLVEEVESPTAVFLGLMKHNGVPVNSELMEERRAEAENKISEIRTEIESMCPGVSIGSNCSTNEFKLYLYKTLGLPVVKTTETNRGAADDQAMQMLKEWCDENKPELSHLFELVQEYRKWGKLKSTYIDGYLKYINPVTGRIHPDFFSLSTDTGRMNCRNPNIQNCPRATNDPIGVRAFIKAPLGCKLISNDFSQIELRVGAFYCRDEKMLWTYRNGGDIHAQTTSVIFGVTYEQAEDKHYPGYKEHRTIAKNVNFGTFYGLFPRGLQKTLKFKAGVDKTFEECAEIIDNLKTGYPGLTKWQEETKAHAEKTCYAETWLGRRRYLPDILSDDWGKKSFAERCALNTPIQGTAADILKAACARIIKGLPERPWLQPILQIHDELVFIVPDDKVQEAESFIKECMEVQPYPEFDVPIVSEGSVGLDFGHMEELSQEDAR
ncbi:MAG: bifunctional 3'-5' exonuclease/DNA polymerase [Oscillospiraceae bacterium]|nr:bifunctional 3'-5' exonuclease/DNA polymerase [Oscillospiraceae bacterium]